jgi:sulfite reductase beta subunit-like hemoprotein
MSSYQSGMDSVRNLTGSPIAGLDPHELLDTRCAGLTVVLNAWEGVEGGKV